MTNKQLLFNALIRWTKKIYRIPDCITMEYAENSIIIFILYTFFKINYCEWLNFKDFWKISLILGSK